MKKLLMLLVLAMTVTSCAVLDSNNAEGPEGNLSVSGAPAIVSGMYVRGTFNNWASTPMAEISSNVWSATVTFGDTSSERFKFDANADWSVNYGDNNADGIAEQNGADITVPAGTKATITFDENTMLYSWSIDTEVSSVTVRPGIDVTLFYTHGPYYYVVPVKVYKDGVLLGTDLIHPTSKDGVQAFFNLDLYADYLFTIDYTNETLNTTINLATNVLIDNRSKTIVLDMEIKTNETIEAAVTVRPGIDVTLFYTHGPYYYVVPVNVYKDGVLIDTDLIHPTTKDGVQAFFNLDLDSDYLFKIDYTNETLNTTINLATNVLIDNISKTIVLDMKIKTNGIFDSTYDQVSVRGTCNNWNPTAMTLVADYTWEAQVSFNGSSSDRFKLDIYNDWSLNFGDNDSDNVAEQSGADIYVGTTTGDYTITFNDQTKVYSVVAPQPFNGSAVIDVTNSWPMRFYMDYNLVTLFKDGVEYTNLVMQKDAQVYNRYYVASSSLPAGSYSAIFDGRERSSKDMPSELSDQSFYGETSFVISEAQPEATALLDIAVIKPALEIRLAHISFKPYGGFYDEAILDLEAVLYEAGVPVDNYTVKKYYYDQGMYSTSFAAVKVWDLDTGVYSFEVDTFRDGTNYNGRIAEITVGTEYVYKTLAVAATNTSQFASTYPSMFLRSDTTGWTAEPMTLVGDHLWKGNATFTNGNGNLIKFDVYGDWSLNFGDTLFRDGIADQDGGNIALRYPTGTFEFFFNDETKAYSFDHK